MSFDFCFSLLWFFRQHKNYFFVSCVCLYSSYLQMYLLLCLFLTLSLLLPFDCSRSVYRSLCCCSQVHSTVKKKKEIQIRQHKTHTHAHTHRKSLTLRIENEIKLKVASNNKNKATTFNSFAMNCRRLLPCLVFVAVLFSYSPKLCPLLLSRSLSSSSSLSIFVLQLPFSTFTSPFSPPSTSKFNFQF